MSRTTPKQRGPREVQGRFEFNFPHRRGLEQDEEWFEVTCDGKRHKMRVHDYAALYDIPGLYEALVYEALKCRSPQRVVDLLGKVLEDWPITPADLRVLDLGAGNGVVAQYLQRLGVAEIVGIDLLPEAREAARRDRPGVYDDYVVVDLCEIPPADLERLLGRNLNCLVSVASLGFGDIPAEAMAAALNLIEEGGWIAMTIKEDFLELSDESGFGRLLRTLIDDGSLEIQAHQRYCHRISISGQKIFYVAIVGRKLRDVPPSVVREATRERTRDNADDGSDSASMFLGS